MFVSLTLLLREIVAMPRFAVQFPEIVAVLALLKAKKLYLSSSSNKPTSTSQHKSQVWEFYLSGVW